jgi:glyoxylase-like metal-dependent hydrolase (beta-lactamase superfamily II)
MHKTSSSSVAFGIALVCGAMLARAVLLAGQDGSPDRGDLTTLSAHGQVSLISIGELNAAVQVGSEGVLIVDTMTEALGDRLLAAIRALAPGKAIRYIVNTSAGPEHTGGNLKIAQAGSQLVAGNFAAQLGQVGAQSAFIVAHENVLKALSAPEGSQAPTPFGAWPTETFFQREQDRYFNDEPLEIIHAANGYTDGDSLVLFRSSDVLVTGEVFATTVFPRIDVQRGGSVNGVIEALNTIIDVAISKMFTEGGTVIVPGRGRLTDEFDVVEYRDMVTIIRDRVQTMRAKGMSLEQVRAARPALEYEPRFGTDRMWTTASFIDAVYRTLPAPPASRGAAPRGSR